MTSPVSRPGFSLVLFVSEKEKGKKVEGKNGPIEDGAQDLSKPCPPPGHAEDRKKRE